MWVDVGKILSRRIREAHIMCATSDGAARCTCSPGAKQSPHALKASPIRVQQLALQHCAGSGGLPQCPSQKVCRLQVLSDRPALAME